ncbi:pentapeptide repeat-containing protein [Phaeobacter inhibens]|uniref:pentapeptide repeat-containing protein n=1 Tax=Phaeobacter inhibens TaxID=221822 RepID=UPI0021A44ED5|nr:pentapeptide repeat-containing protein [Phaeobacter inhibens]UWR69108.1 pentapeptide repeat-containing protein [Phaeobacter inhibens]
MPSTDAVTISLPFTHHQLTMLLATVGLVGLLLLAWYAISVPTYKQKKHRWTGNSALLSYGLCVLPIWAFLLFQTVSALWLLLGNFPPDTGVDLRWHVLAFVGLVTATGGLVGAPLALLRAWANERQTRTAEQNHMTDRITKAVEQLGAEKTIKRIIGNEASEVGSALSQMLATPKPVIEEVTEPNIEVRIGGLLALERISRDSITYDRGRDHLLVMDILCAYVCNNSPLSTAEDVAEGRFIRMKNNHAITNPVDLPESEYTDIHERVFEIPSPRSDIAFAIKILGRRTPEQIQHERRHCYRPTLSRCNLQRADFSDGDYSYMSFFESRMEGAYLNRANFSHCNLSGAVVTRGFLSKTVLDFAKLTNVDFSHAQLHSVSLRKCIFSFTYFDQAYIEDAIFDIELEPGSVNAVRLVNPNLRSAQFEGTMEYTFSGYLKPVHKHVPRKWSAVVFRNATVSSAALHFFDPHRTFGDGSVTLTSGQRPDHWVDERLDDFAFDDAVQVWGQTYERLPEEDGETGLPR